MIGTDEPPPDPAAPATVRDDPARRDAEGSRPGSADPTPPSAGPAADIQGYIGRQLRAAYDDVAKQPVPERFLDLMRQIEQRTETA